MQEEEVTPRGAATNNASRGEKETFWNRMVRLVASVYTHECTINRSFIKSALYIHFVLVGVGLCTVQIALNDEKLEIYEIGDVVVYSTAFLSLASLPLLVYVLFLIQDFEDNKLAIKMFIYMTIAFTYIINPLVVWVATVEIYNHWYLEGEFDLLESICIIISMIVGSVQMIANFLLSRNCLPTGAPLAAPASRLEFAVMVIAYCTLSMSFIEMKLMAIPVGNMLITAASNITLLVCMVVVLGKPMFWDEDINTLYISCYLRIAGLKLSSDAVKLEFTEYMRIPISMVILIMAGKVGQMISSWQRKIDLCNKSISTGDKVFGLFVFLDRLAEYRSNIKAEITVEDEDDEREEFMNPVLLYYLGVWARYLETAPVSSDPSRRTTLDQFIGYLRQLDQNSPEVQKGLLALLGMRLPPYLAEIRSNLSRIRLLGTKKMSTLVGATQLQKLLQQRLLFMYRSESSMDENMVAFKYYYSSLTVNADRNSRSTDHLDVHMVLEGKNAFLEFMELVKSATKANLNLYNYLRTSTELRLSRLRSAHKEIYSINERLLRKLEGTIARLGLMTPTSLYISAANYLISVRGEFMRSKKLFSLYKARVKMLDQPIVKNEDGNLDVVRRIGKNAAIIEAEVSMEKMGTIIDCSADCMDLLGAPESNNPIGMNVNDLFFREAASRHRKMMFKTYKVPELARERPFVLYGFDGCAREVTVSLKLSPKIVDSITILSLIRVLPMVNKHLMLYDEKFELLTVGDSVIMEMEIAKAKSKKAGGTEELWSVIEKVEYWSPDLVQILTSMRDNLKKGKSLKNTDDNRTTAFEERSFKGQKSDKDCLEVDVVEGYFLGTCGKANLKIEPMHFDQVIYFKILVEIGTREGSAASGPHGRDFIGEVYSGINVEEESGKITALVEGVRDTVPESRSQLAIVEPVLKSPPNVEIRKLPDEPPSFLRSETASHKPDQDKDDIVGLPSSPEKSSPSKRRTTNMRQADYQILQVRMSRNGSEIVGAPMQMSNRRKPQANQKSRVQVSSNVINKILNKVIVS